MAYQKNTYSKKEPTEVNIAVEGIAFDLSKVSPDVYNTARKYAVEDIKEEAEIDFIEENDDEEAEFNFNEGYYEKEIDARTAQYIKNALDLPDKGVLLKVDVETASDNVAVNNLAVSYFTQKYGLPVVSVEDVKKATTGDVVKHKTFEAYQKMYESNDYTTCLDLTDNINHYSPNNLALVFAQYPTAEAVKGYQQWKADEFGRNVAQGEKSIQIFAPYIKEFKSADDIEKYCEKNTYYLSQKKDLLDDLQRTGKATIVTGYKSVPVFDIKQTVPLEGREDNLEALLDKIRCNKPLTQDLNDGENVISASKTIMTSVFPDMQIREPVKGESEQEYIFNALYTYSDKLFNEQPDRITGIRSMIPSKGEIHQLETIMGAYLVAKHIGVNEDEVLKKAAFAMNGIVKDNEPMQYRQGKREVFSSAFERAIYFSRDFNQDFDKEFEKLQDLQAEKRISKKKEGVDRE